MDIDRGTERFRFIPKVSVRIGVERVPLALGVTAMHIRRICISLGHMPSLDPRMQSKTDNISHGNCP